MVYIYNCLSGNNYQRTKRRRCRCILYTHFIRFRLIIHRFRVVHYTFVIFIFIIFVSIFVFCGRWEPVVLIHEAQSGWVGSVSSGSWTWPLRAATAWLTIARIYHSENRLGFRQGRSGARRSITSNIIEYRATTPNAYVIIWQNECVCRYNRQVWSDSTSE